MKKLFLINGTLGVGKSATAGKLVELLDDCIHVEGDNFSNFEEFDVHDPLHLKRVIEAAANRCLDAFKEGHKVVVLDYVIGKSVELDYVTGILDEDIDFEIVTLKSEKAPLKDRIIKRNRECVDWELTRTETILRIQKENLGPKQLGRIIDTTKLSINDVALEVLRDFFRVNVAAFVQNKEGKILFCHRRDHKNPELGFQVPQGGVEPGETLEQALARELEEEVFLTRYLIEKGPSSGLRYIWQKGRRRTHLIGQCQYYFLVKLGYESEEIRPSPDFDFYRWVEPEILIEEVVDFKKEVYREALEQLGLLK